METKRIGILGGGQLGRMLALASYPLGIDVKIVDDGRILVLLKYLKLNNYRTQILKA